MNIVQCLRYHTCVCVSVTDIVGSRPYTSGTHPSLVLCKGYRVLSRSLSFNIVTSSTAQKPHDTLNPRVVKLPAFYVTRWCITVYTSLHYIRSWVTLIQSTSLQIFFNIQNYTHVSGGGGGACILTSGFYAQGLLYVSYTCYMPCSAHCRVN
jgi:hypothetical protein